MTCIHIFTTLCFAGTYFIVLYVAYQEWINRDKQ